MAEGRGSRRGVSKKEKAKGALQNLEAHRAGSSSGRNRIEQLQVGEESVYETVDEHEYAHLVSERRKRNANFVVSEDGEAEEEYGELAGAAAYVDTGEEDDWGSFAPNASATPSTRRYAAPASSKPLKRKRTDGSASNEEQQGVSETAIPQSGNIRSMLAKRREQQQIRQHPTSIHSTNMRTDPTKSTRSVKDHTTPDQSSHHQEGQKQGPSTQQYAGLDDMLDDICGEIAAEDNTPAKPRKLSFADDADTNASLRSSQPAWAMPSDEERAPPPANKPEPGEKELDIGANEPAAAVEATPAHLHFSDMDKEEQQAQQGDNRVAEQEDHCVRDEHAKGKDQVSNARVVEQKEEVIKTEQYCSDLSQTMALGGGMQGICGQSAGSGDTDVDADSRDEDTEDAPAKEAEPKNDELRFYFLDAQEQKDRVYLFGKVHSKHENMATSACVIVNNVPRITYAVPQPHVFADPDGSIAQLEQEVKDELEQDESSKKLVDDALETSPRLRKEMLQRAAEMRNELNNELSGQGIAAEGRKLVPRKRSYYLQHPNVPRGEQWLLQVRYSGDLRNTQIQDFSGDHVAAIVGGTSTSVETLLLEQKIHGPSWLRIFQAKEKDPQQRLSWCKHEYEVPNMSLSQWEDKDKKLIVPMGETEAPSPPRLRVMALTAKPLPPEKVSGSDELAAVTMLQSSDVMADAPGHSQNKQKNWTRGMHQITGIRKHPSKAWPARWEDFVKQSSGSDAHGNKWLITSQHSEHSLLAFVLDRISQMDPDVIVGHGLGQDLHLLLYRAWQAKAPRWSRFGRLRKDKMPKLNAGHGNGGGNSISFGVQSALAGRLIADTMIASRELLNEESYSLTWLVQQRLKQQRPEIKVEDIPRHYDDKNMLLKLARANEADSFLSLRLLFDDLAALQLSKQLASLSGCLWSSVLLGQRSQRVEYLLLHEFHKKRLVCPVRASKSESGSRSGKRGQPAYAGGKVFEPKPGLYNKYVVVLDFKSLYPSLICEYNICFTTVNGEAPELPKPASDESTAALIPSAIKRLVDGRNRVKKTLKGEKDATKCLQLKVREQALKLLANSVYGCLGFEGNRFHARSLAELVTAQGREVLTSAKNVAEAQGMEVVYGDTDSIMVSTNRDRIEDAVKEVDKVKSQINKRYKSLTIEKENVFKVLLLLKKKKYVGMKVEGEYQEGKFTLAEERKGVDIVRRDWSELAKDAGRKALSEILCNQSVDDAVEAIHDILRRIRQQLDDRSIPLWKFEIRKQLVRRLETYSPSSTDPHVVVARRRAFNGFHDAVTEGEVVPYVVCSTTAEGAEGAPLHQRAFHPDELHQYDHKLEPDITYYLEGQIHTLVKRLCEPIQGTDSRKLASCLGLDPSRFKADAMEVREDDDAEEDSPGNVRQALISNASSEQSLFKDSNTFAECEPLWLKATDGSEFKFKGVQAIDKGEVSSLSVLLGASEDGSKQSLSSKMLANQVQNAISRAINEFYNADFHLSSKSDASNAIATTRNVTVAALDPSSECDRPLRRQNTAWRLFTQLMYYKWLFDPEQCNTDQGKKSEVQQRTRQAHEVVDAALKRSAYRIVKNFSSWCL